MSPWTPRRLADALGLPTPTAEQAAVVAAPLRPGLVVAGAGSGKTETMAARVVWLAANGLVQPGRVLGLTFTRKAAAELGGRLRRRLEALAAHVPELRTAADGTELEEPLVLTYDAFAASLVAEHGLRLGMEPRPTMLTPAQAWRLASQVVGTWDGPMAEVEAAASTVVADVLRLHHELAAHLVEPALLESFSERTLSHWFDLPRVGRGDGLYAEVRPYATAQSVRRSLVGLVMAYRRAKEQAGCVDYADVAAAAARLAAVPAVRASARERVDVVLLDEFQDTSHAQLTLLSAVFGDGFPVLAVGDPCQAIYGWRGATTGTLVDFPSRFPGVDAAPADRRRLATSFRNERLILRVANAVGSPLREAGLDVAPLRPRRDAGAGQVHVGWHADESDEVRWVARRLAAELAARPAAEVAVLVRRHSQVPLVERALREAGLEADVVGLGGLLSLPEVVDVVAALQVLLDPTRGDALLRLLAGSRWRLGARDLFALGRWTQRAGSATAARTLLDVLDDDLPEHALSARGLARCRQLRDQLTRMRQRLDLPLPELVAAVAADLGVDVEVQARGDGVGRGHLDRLVEVVTQVAEPGMTLADLLEYLDAAQEHERGLQPAHTAGDAGVVHVMTVHAAKGLEFDVVAVPGLVAGTFPSGSRRDPAWLQDAGALPFPLRGDAAGLPTLGDAAAEDQRALRDAMRTFADEVGARGAAEERRLLYVAVTRARRLVLCSGARWGAGSRPRSPSPFLREIAAVRGVQRDVWTGDTPRPDAADGQGQQVWPYDPLGQHRARVERAAAEVRAAIAARPGPEGYRGHPLDASSRAVADVDASGAAPSARASAWVARARLLLAERASEDAAGSSVAVPAFLSVSGLQAWQVDPAGFQRQLRRPVPTRPTPGARLGAAFHAWVANHYAVDAALPLLDLDDLPGAADVTTVDEDGLTAWRAAFLTSSWAARTPREVEAPFELVLDGLVLRGRVDAVFARDDGGVDIVDWKTTRVPADADDTAAANRSLQLAVYRIAFATMYRLPVAQVGAAFHYVPDNCTVRPPLLEERELRDGVRRLAGGVMASVG